MTRRPELDLARALAVSAVLVGHAGYEAGLHPLAARGVDVFFVLSGFLCASQLARGVDPAAWLWRRLRRIYPAAWAVLAIGGVTSPLTWALLDFRPVAPFGHYWSLAVEVSGYLALAVLALAPRAWWVPALLAVVLTCTVGRLFADPGVAYFMARHDGMALGALWALAGAPRVPLWSPLLVLALALPYDVAPVLGGLGAIGLLSVLRGTTLRADWLCSRSFVLYLVHQPLMVWLGPWAGLAASLVAAEVLYRTVDRPIGLRQTSM